MVLEQDCEDEGRNNCFVVVVIRTWPKLLPGDDDLALFIWDLGRLGSAS